MQKDYSVFIGLDVSKDKLDYCITTKEDKQFQFGILINDSKAINLFLKSVSKKYSKSELFLLRNISFNGFLCIGKGHCGFTRQVSLHPFP